jgi:hypothetical protein
MADYLATNNASATLASGVSNVATSLTVATGKGALFPTLSGGDYTFVTIENTAAVTEIVKVTARSTDTFTIVRAQEGTTAQTWVTGDTVELRLTAATAVTADAVQTLTNKIMGNGIVVNSTAVSSSYTIATGTNGFSVGPITVNSGVAVTVSSGQRWVIV